jgi:5-hydroxyisourate hydrolase-like protein (transthyretin family)
MKKSDLVVGKEYLSNGRQNWITSIYDATRVQVLSLEAGSWKWQNGHLVASTMSSAMKGLRVRVLDKKTGEEKGETVVTLASLRGEWEPTFAKVQQNHDDRIQAQENATARRTAARDRVGILMAKVKSFLGYTSDYETSKCVTDVYKEDKVMISVDFLDAMITELDKQGWTYKP